MLRDNKWLAQKMQSIHTTYFSDVPIKNRVLVKFGKKARGRLGSISLRPKKGFDQPVSVININRVLQSEDVPEYVITAVLAHEFVHYTHGFNSPLPRLYKYPHQAGIVDKEMIKRGLKKELEQEKEWTKAFFAKTYHSTK